METVKDIQVGRWYNFGRVTKQDGPTQLKDEFTYVTGIRLMEAPFSDGIVAIYTTDEMGKEEFFEEFPSQFWVIQASRHWAIEFDKGRVISN